MHAQGEFDLPPAILKHFDLATTPYTETVADDIDNRRRVFPDGKLFFDQLLAFASIDGQSLYPPRAPADLRRLLHAIHTSPVDRLKRDCFVYYLVRDADASVNKMHVKNGGSMDVDADADADADVRASTDALVDAMAVAGVTSRAEEFARRRCLSRTWRVFMDAYWALDHGDWETGVDYLSDPAITEINFVPQVIAALTTLVSPPSRALSLVNALARACPDFPGQAERDAALLATASVASMSAAFRTIRALSDPDERNRAREAVWCWALGAPRSPAGVANEPGPSRAQQVHAAQPRALRELLHFPLTEEEHAHLVDFLAHTPRDIPLKARSLLHDLVTLRLVHQGSYAETLALDRELAGSEGDAHDRQKRREMVREFIDILPEAQKRALIAADRVAPPPNGNGDRGGVDADMFSSWIDVEKTSTPRPSQIPPPPAAPLTAPLANGAGPSASPAIQAPTPIRPTHLSLGAPSTPARNQTNSPFSGPPRFAVPSPHPGSPAMPSSMRPLTPSTEAAVPSTSSVSGKLPPTGPVRSVSPIRHVASPFQPPPSSSSRIPPQPQRRPKRIINDDDVPLPIHSTRRSTRRTEPPSQLGTDTPTEPEPEPEPEFEPELDVGTALPNPRKPHRVVSTTSKEPAATPKRATRARPTITSATNSKTTTIATTQATQVTPARSTRASTAGTDVDDMPPPSFPGGFYTAPTPTSLPSLPEPDFETSNDTGDDWSHHDRGLQPVTTARSRITRSASRALLDEPDDAPPKRSRGPATRTPAKRSTRATSEVTDDGATSVRRSTRRAAAASERGSDRGSPTPSMASVASTRSRRAAVPPREQREGSATPRVTRSRR